jgi:glutamine amidotransferase
VIGILDLGMGNLRSLSNAIHQSGFDTEVVRDAARFDDLTHLIIPGVGHFGTAMTAFEAGNHRAPVKAYVASGRPLLGVCLGMQILAAKGTEGGDTDGIGLIAGTVRRIAPGPGYRIPHIGWNVLITTRPHPVYAGLKPERDFYFVHSFALACDDRNDVLGETDYGVRLTAVVGHGNVVGFQFHPEKSEKNGLLLLENFCNWDGQC